MVLGLHPWLENIFRRTGQEIGAAALPIAGSASLAARPLATIAKEGALTVGSGVGAGAAQNVFGDDNALGDVAGQVAGMAAVGGLANAPRLLTPNPIRDPERLQAVKTLADEGVSTTAGQATGNKRLQYMESEVGGDTAAAITGQQAEQYTSATLRRAGINAPRATPEVMDAAFTRIGNDFDDAIAGTTMPLDQQMATEIMGVLSDYNDFVPGGMQAPVVKNVVEGLSQHLSSTGMLDGATYQAYRSQIDKAARGAGANPYLQDALYGIRDAMDGAVERGLSQTNPELVDTWKQARNQYRNLLVIEKAASRGGENVALGLITPQNLRQAVEQQNTRMYVRGQGDFADLARAGNIAMPQLPNSGTAPRAAARMAAQLPLGLGAGAYLASGGDGGIAAMSALGGTVAPAIAGKVGEKAVMNRWVQAYLANQMVPIGPAASAPATRPNNFQELMDIIASGVEGIPVGPVAGAAAQGQIDPSDDAVMRLLEASR